MLKRIALVFLCAITLGSPLYAQKFSKKEQARREAREANYFYGASFTFTSGYVHSWMSNNSIALKSTYYGKSESWGNTNNHFNIGFAWDQAFNRHWGLQTGAYFTNKGGDHLYYYDNGLGYGKILRDEETEEINAQCVELQSQARYFINLTKRQRISLNAGVFVDKIIGKPSGYKHWNLGPQVGIGYDVQHWSVSGTYQPGLFEKVTKNSNSRQSAICVNIGYRLWK